MLLFCFQRQFPLILRDKTDISPSLEDKGNNREDINDHLFPGGTDMEVKAITLDRQVA